MKFRTQLFRLSLAVGLTIGIFATAVVPSAEAAGGALGSMDSSQHTVATYAVCDFDGNGKADLFHRQSDETWHIAYDFGEPWQEVNASSVAFGRLFFADVNGDGRCDVFFKQNNDGRWRYRNGAKGSWKNLARSSVSHTELALCDFDGNGKADVFHRRASDGQWLISYDANNRWTETKVSSVRFDRLFFADVNGDGRCDVFFKQNDGRWRFSSRGTGRWQNLERSSVSHTELALCDFDGNGKADVFHRRASDGQWLISYDAVGKWTNAKVSSVSFTRLMFTDINGDGRCDVVFQQNDGQWRYSSRATGRWTDLGVVGAPGSSSTATSANGSDSSAPADPISAVFAAARGRYSSTEIGQPINEPHSWGPVTIQDFRGGSYGDTALILNPNHGTAYLVRSGFWEHYKNDGGPSRFGAPTSDEGCIQAVDCAKVPAQQGFQNGQWMWYVGGSGVFSGEFYTSSATCTNKQNWLSISHYGVGRAAVISLEPTALGRMSLVNSTDHGWAEWEDCLARPNSLQPQQYDSLYDQLDCHMIFAVPLFDTGGTHFDLETWRSPASVPYYTSNILTHKCNW